MTRVLVTMLLMSVLVSWFWCVRITSLRWIGVRQTDAFLGQGRPLDSEGRRTPPE